MNISRKNKLVFPLIFSNILVVVFAILYFSTLDKQKTSDEIPNAKTKVSNKKTKQINDYNKLKIFVISEPNITYRSQLYEAKIFVAAYDSSQSPLLYNSGGYKIPVKNGIGRYDIINRTAGNHSFSGTYKVVDDKTNDTISFPFKHEYYVQDFGAYVVNDKKDVLYAGIDNSIKISLEGISEEYFNKNIEVKISPHGTIEKRGNMEYVVKLSKFQDVKIETRGFIREFGSKEFRVAKIPDPIAYCNNISNGYLTKMQLLSANGIRAKLNNFEFDVNFNITGFNLKIYKNGILVSKQSQSGSFTNEQKDIISKIKKGETIIFENIKAKGPDGIERNLNPIVINMK